MSELDGIMVAAIRYRSGEGHGQSVEDRAWLLRYLDRQPAVLLRDTPEDRERLVAALLVIGPDRALMDSPERSADAILAALRGSDGGGA